MIHRITPGDILAVRGQSWMSKKIIQITGGPCSHVGLFLSAGSDPLIMETKGRLVTLPLDDVLIGAEKAWVLHPLNLTQIGRSHIIRRACDFSGRRYGWLNLIPQCLDIFFNTQFFSHHFTIHKYPICSAVVGWAYAGEDLSFGQPPQCLSPAEIFRYAQANDDKYKIWEIL